jgi:hypothetical protein
MKKNPNTQNPKKVGGFLPNTAEKTIGDFVEKNFRQNGLSD